eukprot:CAMPEP_0172835074 /NCGR_PEP_ID=MMETSP1075-20121228/25484_1 /TAXON_ID=2916 /ORGANISM="Ceratium fusus, Strain PA161109" /LENGTH=57 /DNA_ID=CAMNT_0013678069 /DNA_START=122 /DNA_END=291 /DNA_ORIENTATION=-
MALPPGLANCTVCRGLALFKARTLEPDAVFAVAMIAVAIAAASDRVASWILELLQCS